LHACLASSGQLQLLKKDAIGKPHLVKHARGTSKHHGGKKQARVPRVPLSISAIQAALRRQQVSAYQPAVHRVALTISVGRAAILSA